MVNNKKYDTIIKGGFIVDGTAKTPAFVGDIGIKEGKIVTIVRTDRELESSSSHAHDGDALSSAPLNVDDADHVYDATGLHVLPGFIDVHVHSENSALGGRDRFVGVLQGVTTQLLSPDGFGWAPLPTEKCRQGWEYTRCFYGDANSSCGPDYPTVKSYLDEFVGKMPLNFVPQVPHAAVRLRVLGWDPRPATDNELVLMKDIVRQWMDEGGAVSFCTGLDYQPMIHADLHELVELSKVVKEYGGLYVAHTRMAMYGRAKAWQETIDICKQSGIGVHISHERVDSVTNPILDEIVRCNIDLTFESYLYAAGMTHLNILFPPKFQPGTPQTMCERMNDPDVKAECLQYLQPQLDAAAGQQVVGNTKSGRFVGMKLKDAAEKENKTLAEFVFDLVHDEEGDQLCILPWSGDMEEHEQTLTKTIQHPLCMIASDGIYDTKHSHPRTYGCFAQVLRKWVREQKAITVEEAAYKMSGFAARRYNMSDRGRLQEGLNADITIVDLSVVGDRNSFESPFTPNAGFKWVLVNGVKAVENDVPLKVLPGKWGTRAGA